MASRRSSPRAPSGEMMTSGDRAAVERVAAKMKKLDLATLERAFSGELVG
jgi:hypothetical protein